MGINILRRLTLLLHSVPRKHNQAPTSSLLITHSNLERKIIKMEEVTHCGKVHSWLRNSKAYLLIISLQFGSAGMYVITMDALNKGMSHYVFVVYRNIIATLALAPFAFFLER